MLLFSKDALNQSNMTAKTFTLFQESQFKKKNTVFLNILFKES